ncbi:hypothetical protein DYB25_011096 [Aphanomyces astaci]|nr:hypothetical protein DYB25_011096 [Aphanomyces astaci]
MTRRQKLEDQRNSLEFQELQACTFAPAINKSTTKPSRGPVVVRGLGRFLELKQLAKRQVAERKEREAKVFTQTRDYTPRAYTVPQPFNLSFDQRRRAREERLKAEMDEKELGECTFQPHTMEHKNRRLIHSLLEQSQEL